MSCVWDKGQQNMPLLSTTAAAVGGATATKQAASIVLMSFAAFGQMVAAFALTQVDPTTAVWSVTEFRAYCILGSVGGAFLKIWAFTTVKMDHTPASIVIRNMSGEFFASGICGLLFSPMVFRYMVWKPDVDSVLAVSGMVSFVGLSLLNIIAMNAGMWFTKLVESFISKRS